MDEDTPTSSTKKYLIWTGIVLVAIFVTLIWPHTSKWDGEGIVDAFPDSDSVKNYRLDAPDMYVTEKSHGWVHTSYTYDVSSMDWPDGGTSYFNSCHIAENSTSNCTDQDGNTYVIDIVSAPDSPVDESSSGYGDY